MYRVARILNSANYNGYSLIVRKDQKSGISLLTEEIGVLDKYDNALSITNDMTDSSDGNYYNVKINILDLLDTVDLLRGLNSIVFLFVDSFMRKFEAYSIQPSDLFKMNIILLDKDGNAMLRIKKVR